jgi:hypothetical protein
MVTLVATTPIGHSNIACTSCTKKITSSDTLIGEIFTSSAHFWHALCEKPSDLSKGSGLVENPKYDSTCYICLTPISGEVAGHWAQKDLYHLIHKQCFEENLESRTPSEEYKCGFCNKPLSFFERLRRDLSDYAFLIKDILSDQYSIMFLSLSGVCLVHRIGLGRFHILGSTLAPFLLNQLASQIPLGLGDVYDRTGDGRYDFACHVQDTCSTIYMIHSAFALFISIRQRDFLQAGMVVGLQLIGTQIGREFIGFCFVATRSVLSHSTHLITHVYRSIFPRVS